MACSHDSLIAICAASDWMGREARGTLERMSVNPNILRLIHNHGYPYCDEHIAQIYRSKERHASSYLLLLSIVFADGILQE